MGMTYYTDIKMYSSEHLAGLMKDFNDSEKLLVYERYKLNEVMYKKLMKSTNNAIKRAKLFQFMIDFAIEGNKASYLDFEITCSKGCSHCCNIPISILQDENSLIKDFIKNNRIILELVEGECIFLKNSICQIYEVRPAVCRKYFSIDNPIECNGKEAFHRKFVPIDADILWSAAISINGRIELQPYNTNDKTFEKYTTINR